MGTHIRVAASTLLVIVALLVLFYFKIGPVVLTITQTHGVHLGDTLGLMAVGVAFWLLYPLIKR